MNIPKINKHMLFVAMIKAGFIMQKDESSIR